MLRRASPGEPRPSRGAGSLVSRLGGAAGRAARRAGAAIRTAAFERRADDGNLLLTMIVLLAIGLMVSGAVVTVLNGEPTAVQSAGGAQAIAQDRSGVSDALFRLDQMGDTPSSFCVGDPPASALPAGLSASSCQDSGRIPLASAPDLQYYVAYAVTGTLPSTVLEEFDVVARAVVGGQARTIHATLYREADSFGFFGVSSFTANGALKQANVEAVGNGGLPSEASVDFGMGPGGVALCTGNNANPRIITVGEQGASVSSCPQPSPQQSSFEPQSPSVCASGTGNTAFAPCVDTASFVTIDSEPVCPLPGSGFINGVSTSTPLTTAELGTTYPDGTEPVFDCRTGGSAVTITTDSPLPFQLSSIPAGTYYIDSNAVTLGEIAPSFLSGPVRIFIVPEACTPATCPEPSYTGTCPDYTSASLSITGNQNVSSGSSSADGQPANWSLYWAGAAPISISDKLFFDGYLYAPSASATSNGATGWSLFGSLVLDCWTIKGSPNLTFAYPFHARQYLLNWTLGSFRLSS